MHRVSKSAEFLWLLYIVSETVCVTDYNSATVSVHNRFDSVAVSRRAADADAKWSDCCLSANTAG